MKKAIFAATSVVAIGVIVHIIASSFHGHHHEHDPGSVDFSVGEPVDGNADRIVHVSMLDTMRFEFTPPFDQIRDGEVIGFVVKNDGNIVHEFSTGNAEDQVAHATMMKEMPDMEHSDPNTVSLKPGETGEVVWRFQGDDTVVFAYNEIGHF